MYNITATIRPSYKYTYFDSHDIMFIDRIYIRKKRLILDIFVVKIMREMESAADILKKPLT